jgi:putative SOS response-associated peptidase YedK
MPDRHRSSLLGDGQRVKPGAVTPVIVADETRTGIKVVELHWGLRPRPGEKPWSNVHAEGKLFPVEERCLVTAQDYLITTKDGPNRGKWLVEWPGDPDMCFAGLCRPALPDWPASFAIITCEPGSDLAPYKDRQSVFLPPAVWGDWLGGRGSEEELLRPLPAGSLKVTRLTHARATRRGRTPAPQRSLPMTCGFE